MKASEKLVIRSARQNDEERMVALGEKAGMGTLDGFEETLVACLEGGGIAGFCRIRTIEDVAYVNPIVVSEPLRGCGVGTALMRSACALHKELRFVARGSAVAFYRSLACEEIPWTDIHRSIACDCDECADFESCRPVPMRMRTDGVHA